MAAWLRSSAMRQAVRRAVSSSGSPSAMQPWPRFVHGDRGLDASLRKHRPSRYLHPSADKVGSLIEELQEANIGSMKNETVVKTIQSIELARRKVLFQNIRRSWLLFGLSIFGFWSGYFSVIKPAAIEKLKEEAMEGLKEEEGAINQ